MKYKLSIPSSWVSTLLLLGLLLAACVPIQPATGGGTLPTADRSPVLTWEGAPLSDPHACGQLAIDRAGQATFGPCGERGQVQPLGAHAEEWSAMQTQFAAIDYTATGTTLRFNGAGTVSGAAWERALAAWAQLVYSGLTAGRTGAAVATAMSWFVGPVPGQDALCQHVIVLVYGYAYAETVPCAGGSVQETRSGVLTDAELAQFDTWQQSYAPIYVENNYLNGLGTQTAGETETQQIGAWAKSIYERLQTGAARAETDQWQRYQADSGYSIAYPLAFYSLRTGPASPHVLFPGVRVVEPNDAFTYRDRKRAVYKLSIAVTVNEQGLSLDQPAALLANSALLAYDPALLADATIQSIELAGVPALRVDDLPVGPAGITTQIVAIQGDFIYELLVEPHTLTTNQADAYVESADQDANRALIEQIIATFQFVE